MYHWCAPLFFPSLVWSLTYSYKSLGQPGSTPNLHIANNHCTPHAPSSSLLILSTILSFFFLPSFLTQFLLLYSIILLLYTTIYYPLAPRPTTTNQLSTFTVGTFFFTHTHTHTHTRSVETLILTHSAYRPRIIKQPAGLYSQTPES